MLSTNEQDPMSMTEYSNKKARQEKMTKEAKQKKLFCRSLMAAKVKMTL